MGNKKGGANTSPSSKRRKKSSTPIMDRYERDALREQERLHEFKENFGSYYNKGDLTFNIYGKLYLTNLTRNIFNSIPEGLFRTLVTMFILFPIDFMYAHWILLRSAPSLIKIVHNSIRNMFSKKEDLTLVSETVSIKEKTTEKSDKNESTALISTNDDILIAKSVKSLDKVTPNFSKLVTLNKTSNKYMEIKDKLATFFY